METYNVSGPLWTEGDSWTEDIPIEKKTSSPKKEKKDLKHTNVVGNVCEQCSKSKVKCDRRNPCARCVRLGLPCTRRLPLEEVESVRKRCRVVRDWSWTRSRDH